ncbi:hypothetical protein DFH09DRAFT_1175464, partial [Mycena vulgaris]
MAGDAAAKAQQLGFADVQVVALADSPLADPKTSAEIGAGPNFFVICVATYNGDPPDAALSFSEMLDAEIEVGNDARFAGINYCVFGAGNTQWGPTYQAFPKKLDANMAALGGNRMFEKGSGDANGDQDGQFTEWATKLSAATAVNFGINVNETAQGEEGANNVFTSSSEYSADSVKVVFLQQPFAADAKSSLMQPPAPGFVQATLRANLELVDKDTPLPRGMWLLTFDVPEGFTYRAGDHMEVFPENDPAVVERLLVALNFVADAVFTVKEVGAGADPKPLAVLLLDRGQITLRELLLYYADLSGPVQRGSLQVLCSFLPPDDNFKSLRETLSEASTETGNTFAQKNRNFPALIETKLLLVLRATQPRRYSIASSPLVDPHIVKLCVGVEDALVADYEGLCSGFLKRSGVGYVVWVRHRAAQESFHLPADPAIPIILKHRRAQGIKIEEHGGESACRLFYGTCYHDMSSLRAMVHAYVNDGTVLLETAYSAEDAPRRFAQQILLRDALTVWRDIGNNGRVYVCGSAARVGQGVQKSLMRIAEQVGGVADPVGWLAGLRKEDFYSEDVFG